MTLKQRPCRSAAAVNLKPDRWPLKTAPLKRAAGHVDGPVGLEPLGHIVVAGDSHETALHPAAANRLGNGHRHHPRYRAVHDARKLVEGYDAAGATLQQRPGQIAAELLPGAQHLIRLDPTGRRAKAHGGEHLRYLFDWSIAQAVDNRPILRPTAWLIQLLAENVPGQCAFAAAGRADDQSDAPPLAQIRHLHGEPLCGAVAQRDIEHSGHLTNAERIEHRTIKLYFDLWHALDSARTGSQQR